MDYRTEAPPLLRDFLVYHETIQGHSRRTVDEYYLDLRGFFRFLKRDKKLVPDDMPMDQIPIDDVDIGLIRTVTPDGHLFLHELSVPGPPSEQRLPGPQGGHHPVLL